MSKHHTQRPVIEPTRVYSREEAAEVLNVSLSTVKRLIAARHLRVSQPLGMRRVLILGQHLLDLIAASEVKDPTQLEDGDDDSRHKEA
jgi:excisionase family DNA binding protein